MCTSSAAATRSTRAPRGRPGPAGGAITCGPVFGGTLERVAASVGPRGHVPDATTSRCRTLRLSAAKLRRVGEQSREIMAALVGRPSLTCAKLIIDSGQRTMNRQRRQERAMAKSMVGYLCSVGFAAIALLAGFALHAGETKSEPAAPQLVAGQMSSAHGKSYAHEAASAASDDLLLPGVRGQCSQTCEPCSSNSQCPRFGGQTQYCVQACW